MSKEKGKIALIKQILIFYLLINFSVFSSIFGPIWLIIPGNWLQLGLIIPETVEPPLGFSLNVSSISKPDNEETITIESEETVQIESTDISDNSTNLWFIEVNIIFITKVIIKLLLIIFT